MPSAIWKYVSLSPKILILAQPNNTDSWEYLSIAPDRLCSQVIWSPVKGFLVGLALCTKAVMIWGVLGRPTAKQNETKLLCRCFGVYRYRFISVNSAVFLKMSGILLRGMSHQVPDASMYMHHGYGADCKCESPEPLCPGGQGTPMGEKDIDRGGDREVGKKESKTSPS